MNTGELNGETQHAKELYMLLERENQYNSFYQMGIEPTIVTANVRSDVFTYKFPS